MAFTSEIVRDITETAKALGIDVAALLAVAEVEGDGLAYADINGRAMPRIYWNAHYFYKLLPPALRAAAEAAGLAAPHGGVIKNPHSQRARYRMLERARAMNECAALEACSWGIGNVLGVHWQWLGYPSVQALVGEAVAGIGGQTRLMMRFIDKRGLGDALRHHDWAAFARGYNGPGYRRQHYHENLHEAHRRHAGQQTHAVDESLLRLGSRGAEVARIQQLLRRLGHGLMLDGDFGPATTAAVRRFQAEHGLTVDGILGPKTEAALEALNGRCEAGRRLRRGSRGDDVLELQQHLNALGYELAEDGHLGATTAIAVMRFQRAAGLVVDGTVGPATATALARELQSRDFAVAS
jgi:hypothetical protein